MKITAEQYAMFAKFAGDDDGFARAGSERDRETMAGFDWSMMRDLLQSLAIVERGLASPDFARETTQLVEATTSDRVLQRRLVSDAR